MKELSKKNDKSPVLLKHRSRSGGVGRLKLIKVQSSGSKSKGGIHMQITNPLFEKTNRVRNQC